MPPILSKVEPLQITSKNILLIEGNDEVNFFTELLKYMGLNPGIDVQPRMVGGKNNFRNEFPAFLNDPNFSLVTAYAIIRDADTSAEATLGSVQKLLRNYGQPCPEQNGKFACDSSRRVGLFILPGKADTGMLEDLCLQSAQDHPIMPHVNDYIGRVKETMKAKAPKNESKAKLQAFLAGMPKTDERLGIAAKWGYWHFSHEAFADIRSFMEELIHPGLTVHALDEKDLTANIDGQ